MSGLVPSANQAEVRSEKHGESLALTRCQDDGRSPTEHCLNTRLSTLPSGNNLHYVRNPWKTAGILRRGDGDASE